MDNPMMRFLSLMTLFVAVNAGCTNLPIGDAAGDDDTPVEDGQSADQPVPDADSPDDTPDVVPDEGGASVEENASPIAIASPRFDEGRDVVLDGTLDAQAFVDGSDSFDRDGEIVAWEWRIDGQRVAFGESASITNLPVGVTRVTLVVTDDSGAIGFDEVRVVNPGFRSGQWRGVTSQGHEVSFEITPDLRAHDVAFGFGFSGRNLLNGVPCPFVETREVCPTCNESVEPCLLDFAWGAPSEIFALAGSCVEVGDPPFERAIGLVAAAPLSNCAGSIDGITWEAQWVSE